MKNLDFGIGTLNYYVLLNPNYYNWIFSLGKQIFLNLIVNLIMQFSFRARINILSTFLVDYDRSVIKLYQHGGTYNLIYSPSDWFRITTNSE